jgi:hypothetical protein
MAFVQRTHGRDEAEALAIGSGDAACGTGFSDSGEDLHRLAS